MNIIFEDWDDVHANAVVVKDCTSFMGNSSIETISFYYDRGRLEILVNGTEVFKALDGTQDFSVNLEFE